MEVYSQNLSLMKKNSYHVESEDTSIRDAEKVLTICTKNENKETKKTLKDLVRNTAFNPL